LNIREERKTPTGVWNDKDARYEYFFQTNLYWLVSDESPALTEQLEEVVDEVKQALPGVFHLTNELSKLMTGGSELFSNLNALAITAQPGVSNLAKATEGLDRPGGLGEWLLPTNIQSNLDATLVGANATLTSANTNLAFLALNLSRSLDNLADITSNLNSQVQANSNIITSIDRTILDADAFVQGLKKHWLFRSAFKSKETNAPAPRKEQPLRTPNDPRRK